MTKADRKLRKRLKQEQAQERIRQTETERQAQIEHQKYVDKICAEIILLFQLLAKQDNPFTEEVRIPRKRWLSSSTRYIIKAGWQIGAYEQRIGGETFVMPLYLLSDGRLYHNGVLGSPEVIVSQGQGMSFERLRYLRDLVGPSEKLKNI